MIVLQRRRKNRDTSWRDFTRHTLQIPKQEVPVISVSFFLKTCGVCNRASSTYFPEQVYRRISCRCCSMPAAEITTSPGVSKYAPASGGRTSGAACSTSTP